MSLIPQDRSKLSPMMQQYLSMKDEHLDQILMFRLGDFYERPCAGCPITVWKTILRGW